MRHTLTAAMAALILFSVCSCGDTPPDPNVAGANMGKLMSQYQGIAADDSKRRKLHKMKEKSGKAYLVAAVKEGLFDESVIPQLVIPNGLNTAAADASSLTADHVAFCAPKSNEVMIALNKRGREKKVVICPDAAHWKMFGEEVPIQFSDVEKPVLTTYRDLKDWDITKEDWADPKGKLFGKKAPFDMIYE